jgi:peptidoglycan/xylan/chitin deacetylase (PgdA/CDA1 family)
MVALTFDMGGRVEPALDIMNWLIAHRVSATIFMTGAMAESPNTEAGREVLRLVAAHPDLFDLGNHSYSHPDFRELSREQMAQELERTEGAIAQVVGVSPRPWFRPPFGGVDADVVAGASAAGYSRTVMWDVDTIDWRPEADGGPTTSQIVAKVVGNAQGGAIVLMHLGGYNTYAALPGIIGGLQANGLRTVTLSEMFD